MTARFVVLAMTMVLLGVRVDAQEPAGDLNQVGGVVKIGDTLTITDTGGQRVQGTFLKVDGTGIDLWLPDEQPRHFDGSVIQTVEVRDSLKNGAIIGAVTGGVVGALAGYGIAYEMGAAWGWAAALTYTGIGTGIGTGIDALVKGHRVIYAKSKTTVSVAPVLSLQRKGVMFTLRR